MLLPHNEWVRPPRQPVSDIRLAKSKLHVAYH